MFPTGCTPIKGQRLSQRQARQPNEKKSEESESFIYIRDILFILADRPGLLRVLASNGLWLIPSLRVPFRPDIVSVRLCHVSTNMSLEIELDVDFFMKNDYRVLIVKIVRRVSAIQSFL